MAAEIGCLKAVLHPSYIMELGIFVMDQAKKYTHESLDAFTKRADQLGLLLCIENLFPKIKAPDKSSKTDHTQKKALAEDCINLIFFFVDGSQKNGDDIVGFVRHTDFIRGQFRIERYFFCFGKECFAGNRCF